MQFLIRLLIIAILSFSFSCVEGPTTTVVSFPGLESCTEIRAGEVVLVRIIFMAESGNSSDFIPDFFSIAAFETDTGNLIGDFSRLDSWIGTVPQNPMEVGTNVTTTPVFDIEYYPPEVTTPTPIFFDTRPFIVTNIDALNCEIQP